ncbi:P-type conjugative transfer protein TrbJ (plasmid) [Pseudomonas sp. WOUb67]|uniref:P-type conjugative transfer protein TrbJ n=1 Tax=Pseudomonas sp. WOUb67 TaxID=3161136 RepID=UPI003CEEAFF2
MRIRKTILAAKIMIAAVGASVLVSQSALAGIPVADGLNLSQTTVSAFQAVANVQKQIMQYQKQLEQYDNMLQNTVAPAAYIWSEVDATISKVVQAQQTLDYYMNSAGSIDSYLSRYQNVDYYRNSSCFQLSGCSATEMKKLDQHVANNSDAVKRTNADVIKSVALQQKSLNVDAQKLQRMQQQAGSARGQMEALGAANQLAAAQANQLIQLRSLLAAQSQAAATIAQQESDKQAQEEASATMLRDTSNITQSKPKTWSLN